MMASQTNPPDDFELLQKSALETSRVVLVRQRAMEFELKQAKLALEQQAARQQEALSLLDATLNASPDGIVATNLAGKITAFNQNYKVLWGLSDAQLQCGDPEALRQHCANQLKNPADIYSCAEEDGANSSDDVVFKDGRVYERHVSLQTTHGVPTGSVVHWHDITKRKRAQDLIWKQANFDSLTSLPNRAMLQTLLAREILKAGRSHSKLALMFIDLDHFKEVNDTFGHDQGDRLLVVVAQRIRSCVRAGDAVARMGGDEFVVLLTDLQDACVASDIAQKIIYALACPFDFNNVEIVVSGSIGITLFPVDATDTEGLLKCADQAMYVSKSRGRNQYSYFTREQELKAQRRTLLLGKLRNALALGQFAVHYQPIYDIPSGRLLKAEALLRWQHPELGSISPDEFIPLAEESGLIVEIGNWVFDQAVHWVKEWRDRFQLDFQISVNKSPVQFARNKVSSAQWITKMQALGLPGKAITIEITEGVLMDSHSDVLEILLAYRDASIQVAIDDFGTGYSSLAYLKRFDIDYLKIDRSFVGNLVPGSSDLVLAQAVIVMAHALGLKVVAEGVETQAQLDLLAQSGCDCAQGFLLSHPVLPEVLERLIAAQQGVQPR